MHNVRTTPPVVNRSLLSLLSLEWIDRIIIWFVIFSIKIGVRILIESEPSSFNFCMEFHDQNGLLHSQWLLFCKCVRKINLIWKLIFFLFLFISHSFRILSSSTNQGWLSLCVIHYLDNYIWHQNVTCEISMSVSIQRASLLA